MLITLKPLEKYENFLTDSLKILFSVFITVYALNIYTTK